MIPVNKFAAEIYQEYYRQGQQAVNQYCQIRNQRPFEPLPQLARDIWRLQTLVWFWASVAQCFNDRKHIGE